MRLDDVGDVVMCDMHGTGGEVDSDSAVEMMMGDR